MIEPKSNPSERPIPRCWTLSLMVQFLNSETKRGRRFLTQADAPLSSATVQRLADAHRPDNGSILGIAAREPAVSLPTPQRTLLLTRWQGALLSLSPQNAYLAFLGANASHENGSNRCAHAERVEYAENIGPREPNRAGRGSLG